MARQLLPMMDEARRGASRLQELRMELVVVTVEYALRWNWLGTAESANSIS